LNYNKLGKRPKRITDSIEQHKVLRRTSHPRTAFADTPRNMLRAVKDDLSPDTTDQSGGEPLSGPVKTYGLAMRGDEEITAGIAPAGGAAVSGV
jgi:hypothetical protein